MILKHPHTKHYCEDVWQVDPVKVCKGYPVGLAWFSPDCKHFSKAKGGKPKDKFIRGLAWVACRWAGLVRPRVIMLENVEEFKTWGPLNRGHHPIKAKQGNTYPRSEQVKRCGNSVCPPLPAAMVRSNLPELCVAERMPNITRDRIGTEIDGQLAFA